MKKLILVALMLCSLSVQALELRMYQVNDRLRIVISDSECGWSDGKQASAQRIDGLYFKGCWHPMEKFPHRYTLIGPPVIFLNYPTKNLR
jgi:hypothetical protein